VVVNKRNKMKYRCNGFKSVEAESMSEAAKVFANRSARRKYGRRGYCRTCTQWSCAKDMRLAEYSAFIGYTTGLNETSGHSINFTVYTA
jgi:hypothetical protein